MADRETSALVREAQARTEQPLSAHRPEPDGLVALLEGQATLDRARVEAAPGGPHAARGPLVVER